MPAIGLITVETTTPIINTIEANKTIEALYSALFISLFIILYPPLKMMIFKLLC
jgi:hypothetical protein